MGGRFRDTGDGRSAETDGSRMLAFSITIALERGGLKVIAAWSDHQLRINAMRGMFERKIRFELSEASRRYSCLDMRGRNEGIVV